MPVRAKVTIVALRDTETFIVGAEYNKMLASFDLRAAELDKVSYGAGGTKTHRKTKHIPGQKQHDKVGRLLVSELFPAGQAGWSGFPAHKHDTDNLPHETRHDETYNFRFKPNHGSGVQILQRDEGVPGYAMYDFTILGGLSQRSLVQFFQPTHAYQVETIPGIKDIIAKFK